MFHPVGSQPPSVYWRRRLLLLGSAVLVVVLLVLLVSTLAGGDGSTQAGPTGPTPTTRAASTPATSPNSTTNTTSTRSGSSSSASTVMPKTCSLSGLQLTAKTGKQTYKVGDEPVVSLQVVNTGSVPCSRDLSDKQIVLRVYNGTSRVWGSHDCAVKSGSEVQTLAAGKSYLFQIQWTGLTSAPGCAKDSRQRVGAGSYTVYASLSGKNATAAQFAIS